MPRDLNFEPASTLAMESVIPPIPGLRTHHAVLRSGVFDYITNTRDLGGNLFESAEAAEKGRERKAVTGFEKGSAASKAYLAETQVVFFNDGDTVKVGNAEKTHRGNSLE